jgi:hypothetical protein
MNLHGVQYHTPLKSIPSTVLNAIMRTFWNYHKELPGVPIEKSVHQTLHKTYGAYPSQEQLLRFRNDHRSRSRDEDEARS